MANTVPEGTYEHRVPHLTVGQLRALLDGLPEDMQLRVSVPTVPTTREPRDRYDHRHVLTGTALYDGDDAPADYLVLNADFDSGLYMLPEGEDPR